MAELRTSRHGFTLIELMIAVSIMGGILASAYLCLQAGYRTREAVEAKSDIVQQARVALDLVCRDLRHAAPPTDDFLFVGTVRVEGDERFGNLDFVSHHWQPQLPGEGDRCEMSLFVDRDPETEQWLLMRRRDPSPDAAPFEGGTREILARGIRGFVLEYYDGYEWVEGWGEEDEDGNLSGYPVAPDPIDPEAAREGIDPETGEPIEEDASDLPTGPIYGQSGLPEAIRVTLAFDPPGVDRRTISDAELAAIEPIVFEAIVRLELAGREPDPGLVSPEPGDFDNVDAVPLDSNVEGGF